MEALGERQGASSSVGVSVYAHACVCVRVCVVFSQERLSPAAARHENLAYLVCSSARPLGKVRV